MTRILVHESLHDELVGRVKMALDYVPVGDPADPNVVMGPLIREAQRARVEELIRVGQQEGAQIAYGGGRPAGLDKGFFVEPTRFVGVDNGMKIAQSEIFGPVGVVTPSPSMPRPSGSPTTVRTDSPAASGRPTPYAHTALPANSAPAWSSSTAAEAD
jgi:acyl-CoA reductase-like NAD-dependent aldehyde dehydrogenase